MDQQQSPPLGVYEKFKAGGPPQTYRIVICIFTGSQGHLEAQQALSSLPQALPVLYTSSLVLNLRPAPLPSILPPPRQSTWADTLPVIHEWTAVWKH